MADKEKTLKELQAELEVTKQINEETETRLKNERKLESSITKRARELKAEVEINKDMRSMIQGIGALVEHDTEGRRLKIEQIILSVQLLNEEYAIEKEKLEGQIKIGELNEKEIKAGKEKLKQAAQAIAGKKVEIKDQVKVQVALDGVSSRTDLILRKIEQEYHLA